MPADDGPEQALGTTDAAGTRALELTGTGLLTASLGHVRDDTPSVTTRDALEVLRLAVGLEPGFGPADPRHYIAADMNGDGRVSTADALEVLRYAVGLSTDDAARWLFFDGHAQTVLLGGESVTEAMLASGFNTRSNFNREFLRVAGGSIAHEHRE